MLVSTPNSLGLWISLNRSQKSEVKSTPSLSILSFQSPWQMPLPLRFWWLGIQSSVEYTHRIWTLACTPNSCLPVWWIEIGCDSSRWPQLLTWRDRLHIAASLNSALCYWFSPLFALFSLQMQKTFLYPWYPRMQVNHSSKKKLLYLPRSHTMNSIRFGGGGGRKGEGQG